MHSLACASSFASSVIIIIIVLAIHLSITIMFALETAKWLIKVIYFGNMFSKPNKWIYIYMHETIFFNKTEATGDDDDDDDMN